jgi:carbonic anhydrase
MFPLLPDPPAPGTFQAHTAYTVHPAHPVPPAPPVRVRPDDALARLVEGNRRFLVGAPRHGYRVLAAIAAAREPRPYAVVVGCMDARVAVEAVLDQDFGDVCVVRSAGNVVDRGALASIELAVTTFGIGLVLVLGHTHCAAVAAAITSATRRLPGRHVRFVLDEIRGAIPAGAADNAAGHPPDHQLAAVTTRCHIARTVTQLNAMLPAGRNGEGVRVAGAIYDVECGRVTLL